MAYTHGRHYRVAQKAVQNTAPAVVRLSARQRQTLLVGALCLFVLLLLKDALLVWLVRKPA